MADFTTTLTTGFDIAHLDLSLLATLPLTGDSDLGLAWGDGTNSVTITGYNLGYTLAGGVVTDVTAGKITDLLIVLDGAEVHIAGLLVGAAAVFDAIEAQDWATLADLLTEDADNIYGTAVADVLAGGRDTDVIYGLAGNDVLDGGKNDDTLVGGFGQDTLTGGYNFDSFFFNVRPTAANADWVTDFQVDLDHIQIEAAKFERVGPAGDLLDRHFHIGATATTKAQRILYDPVTGDLMYDRDGRGHDAAVTFMHLSAGLDLLASNIIIY